MSDVFATGRTAQGTKLRQSLIQVRLLCATAFLLLIGSPSVAGICPDEADDGVPASCPAEAMSDVIEVEMQTSLGAIRLGLLPGVAPLTVANFLSYIASGDYDNIVFHRTFRVPNLDIIQAGAFAFEDGVLTRREPGPTICNEPCIKNERGTIAMAKQGGDPHSASSQWFINVNDSPAIDPAGNNGGFTVFGRVLEGIEVVDSIANLAARLPSRTVMSLYTDLDYDETTPVIADMPLLSELEEDPQGYGCFDTADVGVDLFLDTLIGPVSFNPDPLTGHFPYVSLGCVDAKEPDPVVLPGNDCSAEGACLIEYDVQSQSLGAYVAVTHETVSRSSSGLTQLRADMIAQLDVNSVHVTVPEPRAHAAGLLTVALIQHLARRRKKARR